VSKRVQYRRKPRQRAPLPAAPRIVLLHGLTGPDGEPRAAVAMPGCPIPTLFPTIAAALAALRTLEAAR
ncbi:hypothetical protein M0638_28290, partial [Roseomonas sp. NAR14]